MLEQTKEWAASVNGETFHIMSSKIKKAAINEAVNGNWFDEKELYDGIRNCIWIGRVYKFKPVLDADDMIEYMQGKEADEVLDIAEWHDEDYLENIPADVINDLEDRLTKVFREWEEENNLQSNFFVVMDPEKIYLD